MVKAPRLLFVLVGSWAGLTLLSGAMATPKAKPGSSKSTSAAKSPAKKSSGSKSKSRAKPKTASRKKAPPKQTAPTPDRIQEIQEALSRAGFPSEPTGAMDASTIESLKKFQEKQSLEPTGKLSSLTLIALGLGPSHGTAPERANPPAPKDGTQP